MIYVLKIKPTKIKKNTWNSVWLCFIIKPHGSLWFLSSIQVMFIRKTICPKDALITGKPNTSKTRKPLFLKSQYRESVSV